MKYAVVGAGAVGAVIGALPAVSGREVWFVDPFEQHVNEINENGLQIEKLYYEDENDIENINVQIKATTNAEDVGKADVVILMVKGIHTESSISNIEKLCDDNTIILTIQNGLGNVDILEKYFNKDNIAYGVTNIASQLVKPGFVKPKFKRTTNTYIGSKNKELKDKLTQIAKDFTDGGGDTEYTDNIDTVVWNKLAINCSANALCGLLRVNAKIAASHQEMVDIVTSLVDEIVEVAGAKGIKLNEDVVYQIRQPIPVEVSPIPTHFPSTAQDMLSKKATEIEFLNGAIAREGKKVNVPTPYNELIYKCTKIIESSYEHQA